jgi:hypothetical protein
MDFGSTARDMIGNRGSDYAGADNDNFLLGNDCNFPVSVENFGV